MNILLLLSIIVVGFAEISLNFITRGKINRRDLEVGHGFENYYNFIIISYARYAFRK